MKQPLRVLMSYHYFKRSNVREMVNSLSHLGVDVFADSGAYSAFTTGATITVREYAAWLKEWRGCFSAAAALDVIGNPHASLAQTHELVAELGDIGCPVIPVYHGTDGSIDWLDRYIDAGFKYIGIAPGPVRRDRKLFMHWLRACFARKPDDVGYHGFAVTGIDAMRAFPWYSVDSTSWMSGLRYGNLGLWDAAARRYRVLDMRNARKLMDAQPMLGAYGLQLGDVRADDYNMPAVVRASALSCQRLESYLSKTAVYQQAPRALTWPGSGDALLRYYLGVIPGQGSPNSPTMLKRVM